MGFLTMPVWLLLEAAVSHLDSDTVINSKLLPGEHCIKGNHKAKGLRVSDKATQKQQQVGIHSLHVRWGVVCIWHL